MVRADTPRSTRPSLRTSGLILALSLLLAGLAGCLPRPSATPPGTLSYEGPQAYTLKPGDLLPATDIRYVGRTSEGAEFSIGGQRAIKQKADSLFWSGAAAAGVKLDLRLRVVWFTDQALYTAGTAKVTISDLAPQPGTPAQGPLAYDLPVVYALPLHAAAPGTTLSYEGKATEGAQFGGVEGVPYRQMGDSVRWEGQVRSNVSLRLDVRVLQYDEGSARVGGTAHLWVRP